MMRIKTAKDVGSGRTAERDIEKSIGKSEPLESGSQVRHLVDRFISLVIGENEDYVG
jgi:hypothetical protein